MELRITSQEANGVYGGNATLHVQPAPIVFYRESVQAAIRDAVAEALRFAAVEPTRIIVEPVAWLPADDGARAQD